MIGISGSLIWSKTLMELIFNLFGEFRWSPEDPVSQIHSPHLHVGAPGIISDLLNSVQMLKRVWGAESNWKLPHLFIPSKPASLVLEFAVEDLPSAELQLRFLHLQWMTCPWTEYSNDDDDDDDHHHHNIIYNNNMKELRFDCVWRRWVSDHAHNHQCLLPKSRSYTANLGTKAAVLP